MQSTWWRDQRNYRKYQFFDAATKYFEDLGEACPCVEDLTVKFAEYLPTLIVLVNGGLAPTASEKVFYADMMKKWLARQAAEQEEEEGIDQNVSNQPSAEKGKTA